MIDSLRMDPVALTLAGGVDRHGGFAVRFLAIVFLCFTETGPEIRFHAWGDRRGDAPGSLGVGNVGSG